MMRTHLPGTHHSSTFNRQERSILESIAGAPSVRKLKTGRMDWTGPTHQQRLQLRAKEIEGTSSRFYAGVLFTGAGKRHLKLYPTPGASIEALCQDLGGILERHGVIVEISPHHKMEETAMQITTNGQYPVPSKETWEYCELVYDFVEQAHALQYQEEELATKLETVRRTLQEVKAHAMEAMAQALRDLPTTQ